MWPVHKLLCGARFLREQTALEQLLYRQSRGWLRLANPLLLQYAIWALNIAEFGPNVVNRVWYVQTVTSYFQLI